MAVAGATEAARDHPGARRVHRAVTGRGQLCPTWHARLGRDRGARARRGRRARIRGGPDRPSARGGATAVVGLLVGSLADFWNQELVRAVERELHVSERSTLVADADGDSTRELELAGRLVDHRVDGLIVLPVGPSSDGWGADRRGGAHGHDRRLAARRDGRWRGRLRQQSRRQPRTRSVISARSAIGVWRSCRGRSRRRPGAPRARRRGGGGRAWARVPRRALRLLAERLAAARARAAVSRRPPDRDVLHVGLDRLRGVRGLRRARPDHPRRRVGGRLWRASDVAAPGSAAHLDGVGRGASRPGGHPLPAGRARRRAARRTAAGAVPATARRGASTGPPP